MKPSHELSPSLITPGIVLSRQLMAQQERFHDNEEVEILDHQQEALAAINSFLNSGEAAGHVEMATATGKTYLMSSLAQAAADLGMRTLILAPTVRVAEQLHGEDGSRGLGKFTDLHETGRTGQRYGDKLSTRSLEQPVVITTYQSLNALHKAGLAPTVDLVIADEAHRSLGDVTSQTIEEFSPNAIKMGFTATPSYTKEKSLDQLLPVKIFSLDIRESVERGLTPPISSIIYETGDEIPVLDPARSEFTERELERLITLKSRNESIVKFTKNFVESGMQGAVACIPGSELAHARLVADELNKITILDKDGESRTIRAASVGSHRTPEDNQRIIEAYDNKQIDVLSFVYSLEQGWDSDRPQFVINASPTTSTVRETQLLGRLLRGEDEVFFVDFFDIAKKHQFTSLHVLGEEKIELKRRIGGHRNSKYKREQIDIGDILDKDLYEKIQFTDGKLLSQLYFGENVSENDRLIQHWNRILEQDGLPEEPGAQIKASEVAMRGFLRARHALGDEASLEALTDYELENQQNEAGSYNSIHERMTSAHLEIVNRDMANIDDLEMFVDIDSTTEIVENLMLRKQLDNILNSLSERESGIIRMYHGISGDDPKSFRQIGEYYGLTGSAISQTYSKAMAKLRHPSRSESIKDFLNEYPAPSIKKESSEQTIRWVETPHYLSPSFYLEDRNIQRDQAIRDLANTTTLPAKETLIYKLLFAIQDLRGSIDHLTHPDPRKVETIVQMEGYLAGIEEFYTDPKGYIAENRLRRGQKHRTIQDVYEEMRKTGEELPPSTDLS